MVRPTQIEAERFDTWPHDPEEIVQEALREFMGDGDGEDAAVLAAFVKVVREQAAAEIEEARREPYPTLLGFLDGMDRAIRVVRANGDPKWKD